MNRRSFLTTALAATAGGLLVPEWILDPPKGRSMVTVPQFERGQPVYNVLWRPVEGGEWRHVAKEGLLMSEGVWIDGEFWTQKVGHGEIRVSFVESRPNALHYAQGSPRYLGKDWLYGQSIKGV